MQTGQGSPGGRCLQVTAASIGGGGSGMVFPAVFRQGVSAEVPRRIVPHHVYMVWIATNTVVLKYEGRPMQSTVMRLVGFHGSGPGKVDAFNAGVFNPLDLSVSQ